MVHEPSMDLDRPVRFITLREEAHLVVKHFPVAWCSVAFWVLVDESDWGTWHIKHLVLKSVKQAECGDSKDTKVKQ